ncbi:MAG: DUF3488 domain-containing transglutaminase family protein [Lautropia sp.]|nr:DUF3488 domain-containing transglutaminase family protein [Lautropia sp.]
MKKPRRASRLSIRVLGGRLGPAWERDRRDTLFLMGAVLLSVLPQVAYLPLWCSAGFFILFTWRLGLIFSGHALPGAASRLAAAAAIVGAVFAQYHTLLGREAGVALLVLFLGLKLMEMRARRDLFVVIFLCCFLLLTGYFHSQGIMMAAATMIALLTLVASMLTMQFRHEEIPVPQRLRYASVLLLQAIPVAAALFVLFPRPSGPLWGLPDDAYGGRTGLSDSMSPGEIANLAESEEVVMRVGFEEQPPQVSRMYWRGPSFGEFDGRVWRPSRYGSSLPPQPEVRLRAGPADAVRYTATMEPSAGRWVLAMETATQVPVVDGRRIMISPSFELIASEPLAERLRYVGVAQLDAQIGRNESRATLQNWLGLPAGFNPRTLEMAARWRAEGDTSVPALVERAMDWLRRDRFTYTLTPPLLGRHTVDEFLFDTKAGFCEHFSSAFVVLMRALGVPARVVTGYQGAERNEVDDYWIVRQSNAHAWAEVWMEASGWTRVDPTSAVAPERIERGATRAQQRRTSSAFGSEAWLRSWRLNLDALTHSWNQWVLAYDRSRQQSLLARFGIDITDWREAAGVIAGVLGLLLGAVALGTLRPRMPKDPVERQFDEFCQRLAAIGAERFPYETANNYLYRIDRLLDPDQSELAHDIVATYNRLRYDLGSSQRDILEQLKRMVRSFKP